MTPPPAERSPAPAGLRRHTRVFLALIVATVLLYLLGMPAAFGVLLTAPAALIVGGLALMASRGQESAGSLRIGLSIGMVVAAMATFLGLGMVVFYDALTALQECTSRAITQQAQRQCQVEYEEAYQERMREWGLTTP